MGGNQLAGKLWLTIVLAIFVQTACGQDAWPRFRGPNGSGLSAQKGFPATWTDADYAWNVPIAGIGHSSPIVWGDQLFVTSAERTNSGTARKLFCLNSLSGKTLWHRTLAFEQSHLHKKNSWASGTPATDGERVYVVFSDEAAHTLIAFDFDGTEVWRRDLGSFKSQHGQGASPIVFRDMVILPNDQLGPSHIFAFNKRTGDVVWKTRRTTDKTSYATPMVLETKDSTQIICVSDMMGVTSLDPTDGRINWSSAPFPLRTVASPIVVGGTIFASCGSGGTGKLLLAVNPAADQAKRVRFDRKTTLPYVPTPVGYEKQLYLWTDIGVVVSIDAATGKETQRLRVNGKYSGSPVCVDGRLYCISEAGRVVVVSTQPKLEVIGKTSLRGESYATPAIANGRMYLRTFDRLMCLKAKN